MFDFAGLNLGRVDTIVDVGAGYGAFLEPALEFYKPSRALAIEMLNDRCAYLRQRFPGVAVWQGAVGERHSAVSAPILRTVFADSSSLLTIDPRSQEWFGVAPRGMNQFFCGATSVCGLDDILEFFHQGAVIDLMKMDIQGYEGRAIRGGGETLKRTRALIIEMLFCHHYEGQSMPEEIHDELTKLEFRPDKLLEDNWNGDVHLQQDWLYVNANI